MILATAFRDLTLATAFKDLTLQQHSKIIR